MATKPTQKIDWGTDAGVTIEPSAGRKAAGFKSGETLTAQYINWLFKLIDEWIAYIKDGALTGNHTITGTLSVIGNTDVTGTLDSTGKLTVTGGGASIAGGDVTLTGGDLYYAGNLRYSSTRITIYPPSALRKSDQASWILGAFDGTQAGALVDNTTDFLLLPLVFEDIGCEVTKVQIRIKTTVADAKIDLLAIGTGSAVSKGSVVATSSSFATVSLIPTAFNTLDDEAYYLKINANTGSATSVYIVYTKVFHNWA